MSTRYSWPLRSKEGPSRKESTACPGLLASTQPEGWLCSRRVSGRRLNKVVETSVGGGYRLMVALLLALLADHGKGFLCNSRYIGDRKSTRLNSSHVAISYAVFCLKKKNRTSRHVHLYPT